MLGLGSTLVSGAAPSKTPQTFTFQMTPGSVTIPSLIIEYETTITGTFSRASGASDAEKYTTDVIVDGIDISSATGSNCIRLNGTATLTVTRASTDYTVTLNLYATAPETLSQVNFVLSPLDQSSLTTNPEKAINADDFTPNLPDLTDGQTYMNLDSYSLVFNAIDPDPVIDSDTYDATDSSAFTQTVSVAS